MKPKTVALVLSASIACVALAAAFVIAVTFPFTQAEGLVFNDRPPIDVAIDQELPAHPTQPLATEQLAQMRQQAFPSKNYTLSSPRTHGNLTVFLVQGPDVLQGPALLTLQEALAMRQAVVNDTGVALTVSNLSNQPLFIQAGDIVKGGNQDRVLPYDQIIPPQVQNISMAAYCVEAGRSGPRGEEISASFEVSSDFLPGRGLKLAAFQRQSQTEIWNEVARLQEKLNQSLEGSVQAPLSPTSLQLTLEHPRLSRPVFDHLLAIEPMIDGKENAIGCVVAVNGRIQSADVYGSSELFRKFWPKLIRAAAVDALAQQQGDEVAAAPSAETVQAFLQSAESGRATKQDIAGRTVIVRQEGAGQYLVDACLPEANVSVHRTYLSK